jgi:dihydrofolate synthase / folylpolyglutamate synthase
MHENSSIAALLNGLNNPSLPSIDLSLARMQQLLAALGHPEQKLPPVIHLAGTNGKGSTLAFLKSIYEATGYRVHAYTSPHLVRFNERIVIAGQEVSDDYLLQLLEQVSTAAQTIPVTFFEATTAAAFLAFAEHLADVVLLETGLGGRLDATNVVPKPIATIITPIDYDHMEFLGNSLSEIAGEKAGIMKAGAPCFVGAQKPEAREVLKRAARKAECELHLHDFDWNFDTTSNGLRVKSGADMWDMPLPSLAGTHQLHNAALASVVAMNLPQLPISIEALRKGVSTAIWPARLQKLVHGPLVDAWGKRGDVYLDGGHNIHAAETLQQWMKQRGTPITLILGMMKRKDARGFLQPLAPHLARVITVPIEGNECYSPTDLAEVARGCGVANVTAANSLMDAAQHGAPAANATLLITGSLFLAGEVLKKHG